MKIITTTREYDEQGRMVKETVMETVTPDWTPPIVSPSCTCGTSTACPLHYGSRWWAPQIICGGTGISGVASDVTAYAIN